jgi:glycolate oxidase
MELIDTDTLDLIREYLGHSEFRTLLGTGNGGSYLLVQFDAGTGATAGTRAFELIEQHGGIARLSHNDIEAEGLLRVRRSVNEALTAAGTILVEDIAVPRSRIPEMFAEIQRISSRHRVRIPTIAHAGDGNQHPTFVFDGDDVPAEVWTAADDMFEAATKYGGTLTGRRVLCAVTCNRVIGGPFSGCHRRS